VGDSVHATVYDAYLVAMYHAIPRMRSVRTAFEHLANVDPAFQAHLPLPAAA
jgi:hypothetical protein